MGIPTRRILQGLFAPDIATSYWQMIIFLALMEIYSVYSSPEILVPPKSVNAIAGDPVIFHCVVRAEELDWLVNKTRADEQTIVDKGFMQGTINDINETTRERTLTATGLTQYSNTNITCRALNLVNDFGVLLSEPAVLLVQGSLPPNAALSSSFIDLSTVNISWSPPFALPSTIVTKYNISVTSNVTTTNYFTSNSYFVLQLSNISNSPCDEINVTVSRYNTVSGIISMPVITFYPLSVASSGSFSPNIMVDLNETDMLVGVTFSINVSDLCQREYPEHVEIRVLKSDSGTLEDEETFSVSVSENVIIIFEDASTLDSNQRYRAEVFFQIPDGNLNISGAVNFSTFAVQSVQIYESSTLLEVQCFFAPNTEATGCEVKIEFLLNSIVIENKIVLRANRMGNSALLTFLKVLADEYLLYVFEIEKTGSVVQVDVLTGLFTLSIQLFSSESISRVISTTPTMFQMVSSTYLISPFVSSSTESGGGEGTSNINIPIISGVSVLVSLLLTCVMIVFSVILFYIRKRKKKLFVNGPDVLLDTNPAYVDHKSLAEQIKQHSDIALKNNEAYMEVILDPRSGGYKDCVRVNN